MSIDCMDPSPHLLYNAGFPRDFLFCVIVTLTAPHTVCWLVDLGCHIRHFNKQNIELIFIYPSLELLGSPLVI